MIDKMTKKFSLALAISALLSLPTITTAAEEAKAMSGMGGKDNPSSMVAAGKDGQVQPSQSSADTTKSSSEPNKVVDMAGETQPPAVENIDTNKEIADTEALLKEMKEKNAPPEQIKEVETALDLMKKTAFLMKSIETDANSTNADLKKAVDSIKNAQSEKDGMPAMDRYVELKKKTLSASEAAQLQSSLEAFKEAMKQMAAATAAPPPGHEHGAQAGTTDGMVEEGDAEEDEDEESTD